MNAEQRAEIEKLIVILENAPQGLLVHIPNPPTKATDSVDSKYIPVFVLSSLCRQLLALLDEKEARDAERKGA